MSRIKIYDQQYDQVIRVTTKRYGFWAFIFDVFMTFITGGIWLIWIFVREMRRR